MWLTNLPSDLSIKIITIYISIFIFSSFLINQNNKKLVNQDESTHMAI